jgi:hypothetical protein
MFSVLAKSRSKVKVGQMVEHGQFRRVSYLHANLRDHVKADVVMYAYSSNCLD